MLKAPGHEMFLPTIRRLLPNAIFVRISREPEARIRSWTQLAVQLRRLFGQPSGASELQFWEQLWREGADLFSDLPSRFRIDLSFQDVIENPYRVALRLAAAIDAEPPRRARVERAAALLRSLASQP